MQVYNNHQNFMHRCLQLAKKGLGHVAPNPMVGAVIVHNGKIIGEGYHKCFGQPHAEVNAINSVNNKQLLASSTIYVSLEPCSHYGKTPPCADLIIYHKIPNVVIGTIDSFAKVNGEGIKRLRDAGINVTVGVLEQQCRELITEFTVFNTQKRPYIILKWAQTADGFIDKIRLHSQPAKPNWITDNACRSLVHKWRTQVKAIMVGTNTALYDNPKLNVRNWVGPQPVRVVTDKNLRLPPWLNLFDSSQPTIVLNSIKNEQNNNIEYIKINFDNFFDELFKVLYSRGLSSLFVEGGAQLLNSFINNGFYNEVRVFTSEIKFFDGVKAPQLNMCSAKTQQFGNSFLQILHKT